MPALRALSRENTILVCALVDTNPARTAGLAGYFPDAIQLEHPADLEGQGLELAIVASPPRYHAEHVIQLVKTGHSVLCEKPLATTVIDAQAALTVAADAPGVLALGLSRRFFPTIEAMDQILSAGWLGNLESFHFSEGNPFHWPVKSPVYFNKREMQGVLMDIGSHALDLVIRWFGAPEQVIYQDDALGGIEANARIELRFAGGLTGEVRLSRDCELENCYYLKGSRAWVRWPVNETHHLQMGMRESKQALEVKLANVEFINEMIQLRHAGEDFETIFVRQIRNVVGAMHNTEQLRVSGEQGLASLELIERCYRHRTMMPMPWLGDLEWARALELGATG